MEQSRRSLTPRPQNLLHFPTQHRHPLQKKQTTLNPQQPKIQGKKRRTHGQLLLRRHRPAQLRGGRQQEKHGRNFPNSHRNKKNSAGTIGLPEEVHDAVVGARDPIEDNVEEEHNKQEQWEQEHNKEIEELRGYGGADEHENTEVGVGHKGDKDAVAEQQEHSAIEQEVEEHGAAEAPVKLI